MQVWQMLYGRDILDWISINVSRASSTTRRYCWRR